MLIKSPSRKFRHSLNRHRPAIHLIDDVGKVTDTQQTQVTGQYTGHSINDFMKIDLSFINYAQLPTCNHSFPTPKVFHSVLICKRENIKINNKQINTLQSLPISLIPFTGVKEYCQKARDGVGGGWRAGLDFVGFCFVEYGAD